MASFDSALGMWKSKNGQYYNSQSEALDAERNFLDDGDFIGTGGIDAQAPDAVPRAPDAGDAPNPNNPGGISDNELAKRRNAISTGGTRTANINITSDRTSGTGAPLAAGGGATGAYNAGSADSRAAFDYSHELGSPGVFASPRQAMNSLGERAGVSHAGDVANPNPFAGGVVWSPEALFTKQLQQATDPKTGLGTTLDDGSGLGGTTNTRRVSLSNDGTAPTDASAFSSNNGVPLSFDQGQGRAGIDKETEDAKNRAGQVIEDNRDENAQLFADAFSQYDNLQGSDYGLSDEARGYQREGLQQQRMLLQKMLGFDEDKFAKQYADRALAGTIAAGRSAGGGYAGQQAGMFAAMDKAPELYAEGQRQASTLGNQRLQMAETAAKGFGDLGTMTRGQDEQRAQFESNLGLSIADSVSRLTEGNVQMNDRDSAQMAEIWMDFAKLQSVYAGMTSDEQLAWWQQETARRGQDKQFDGIMASLKQQGAVSSKDLIGGLFQLGGGLLSAGGTMGAAYINRPQVAA